MLSRRGTSDLHFERIPLFSVMRKDCSRKRRVRGCRPTRRLLEARSNGGLHQGGSGVQIVRSGWNLDTF